ncbi:uncharacterized protein DUF1080 [Dyadobacter jejuensis]|uniref:Uncharacterized protein DUF1080 n=1 Tax=Dyadobacter jejuensis TaxID=1082580 RepID=A0A316AFG2_9BACT|nr:DUF1080 domain-containing protein [Dyadobacter jejuensis]PWJ55998.1 uncharacterized protein DUF1080 [Dyadobacter jejuensis]
MKQLICLISLGALLLFGVEYKVQAQDGWKYLFNGKDLSGWQVGENAASFSVSDGRIKVAGPKAHLFYMGEIETHNFENFEFQATVMTLPGSNSGIYFHTTYQEASWPQLGYEVQVNNSHTDWKRTGSLYNVVDIKENYARDNEWYTEYIRVEGTHIIVKINGVTVVDYEEKDVDKRPEDTIHRVIKSGTFALQAHDPKSIVYFKDIKVRLL